MHEGLRALAARDEPGEPAAIGARQHLCRLVPVPFVGVHAADDDVVLQDHLRGHIGAEAGRAPAAADPGEADDAARRHHLKAIGNDFANAGALDDHVGSKPTSVARPVW